MYTTSDLYQCRMLEAEVSTNILAQCLNNPTDAPAIIKSMKQEILKSDFEALLSSTATHHSARYVAEVAKTTSWCRLWDSALDRGVQGTRGLQTLLKTLSQRIYRDSSCASCGIHLQANSLWFDHICLAHPEVVNYLSCEEILSCLKEADADRIFTIANSRLNSIG